MISAILCDGGGVFIRFGMNVKLSHQIAREHGLDEEKFRAAWKHLWPAYAREELTLQQVCTQLGEQFHITLNPARVLDIYASILEEIPGTREIIASLKGKYLLVLANNESKEFDELRNEHTKYWDLFDVRCSSWILKQKKPDPEFFHALLEKINRPAAECLFIDDLEENVSAAAVLGMETIKFTNAVQLRDELSRRELL